MNNRRVFLQQAASLAGLLVTTDIFGNDIFKSPKTILLRSSWQTVNIGDIGHTPGALQLFKQHLPNNTKVILWPSSVENGVAELLQSYFPNLTIAKGSIDKDGKPSTPELVKAFQQADIFVHGSGPSLLAQAHVEAWRKLTNKPYGIFGITIGAWEDMNEQLIDLLNNAAFIYLRDTISLKLLQDKKIKTPVLEFGPDATFAIPLRNDMKANTYLKSVGLESKQFICVIPRLRYTPYYQIHNTEPTAEDLRRKGISDEFKEKDHAKLREVMMRWVRETGLKILACPEMTYEIPIAKELLIDPLPEDIKKNVIWRDSYWLPDEATSVYNHAKVVVSFEMHSPIMAFQTNTPAFYLRQPTDTSKGQMWRDVGLNDWIFEIDDSTGSQIADRLMQVNKNYDAAMNYLKNAQKFVQQRQAAMAKTVKRVKV